MNLSLKQKPNQKQEEELIKNDIMENENEFSEKTFTGTMYNVHAGNIAKIGWMFDNKTKQGILRVEFDRGGLYEYFPVSKTLYDEFWTSDKKGSWFHHNIKTAESIGYEKIENI